jgi:hypothetical protein
VGERGIVDELAAAGIASVGGPDHNGAVVDGKELDFDPEVRPLRGARGGGGRWRDASR